jgi:Ser/Thr protein kinase RdoA (MazF antagonist)
MSGTLPSPACRRCITTAMDELTARLTTLLERHYGAHPAALHPIYEAEGAIYRVQRRDGPPWVLRLFPRSRPLERVQGDAVILVYVERHGVPAERLVTARDGSGSTVLDGRGVLVTTAVEGRRPDRSPTTLRRLGEVVGRLHALPAVPAGDRWLGRRAGALPAQDLAAGHAYLARIAGRVPPERRTEYEMIRAALDATDDCEALPAGLIHSDCHLDNAICTPEGQPVLIDWAGGGQGPRVAAVGLLLYSSIVQAPGDTPESLIGPHPAQIRRAIEAVVDGYCRHHLLTPAELEHLPHAVRFRPAVIAARELATGLERGQPPDPSGWWTRYAEADAVAHLARAAMERHL